MTTTQEPKQHPGQPRGEPRRPRASTVEEHERQKTFIHSPGAGEAELDVKGGEGSVYQMQARHAQAAAQEALKDAANHLLHAADIRALVRRYPWAAVGSAAAVGFLAASVAIPSKSKRAEVRLRALERALQDEAAVGDRPIRKSRGMGGRLLRMGWRIGRPMLLSMMSGAVSGAGASALHQATGTQQEDAAPPEASDVT